MNKLPEQLYRLVEYQVTNHDNPFRVTYSALAHIFVTELPAVYDALNQLVLDDRIWYEAVGQPLGEGDYLCEFRVKG